MSNLSREMVRLDPSRAREAAEVLTRAFMRDPLQSHTFPDPFERAEMSIPHFEAVIRYGLLAGHVWVTTGGIDAVGVWLGPEHIEFRSELLEESGFTNLPAVIGSGAFHRFMGVIEHLETLHKRDVPEPHWYAMVLGVDPSKQGQGLGRQLLRTVFDLADAAHTPCYLETTQPANVHFYTANGFRVLIDDVEPASGLRYWTFARDPLS